MAKDVIQAPLGYKPHSGTKYSPERIGFRPGSNPASGKTPSVPVDSRTLNVLKSFSFKERTESTCVNDVIYDPTMNEMTIVFQQRGTYKYSEVPLDVYVDFETSGSRGTYFNLYIKDSYSYERIA